MRSRSTAALMGCLLAVVLLPAADPDYSAELPRIPPKEPTDALKTFKLRSGFHLELVAAEPLLRSPVAAEFDENGRLFVAEYPEYNQYANKDFKDKGRIRLLEDADGDGRYEKSTIYVDNLDSPVALACWDGGVFVGSVPDLLYFKDTNGDGKADVRKVILTGFGRDAAGEAMLNSFRWGLDNRFHLSTSLAGGNVKRTDSPDAKTLSVRGLGLRFDPRTLAVEIASGGGQHGMSLDDWGRTFVCDNSNPIRMLMYESRYLSRNPYVQAPPPAVDITPAGKFTQIFRISPNEPWRVLRTRLRSQGVVAGSDEGGKPSGFFTGATGVTVYRGDAWPTEYRGNVFVGEVSGNLVYRARLEANGVGLSAVRADPEVEFLASSDNWFRPVQFAHGPDGNLYIVDMYRELIEGAAFLPPQILKHLDVASGVDRGRIYRIAPDGFQQPKPRRLSDAKTAELVALLEHPNGWHRDTASRLLYLRQDRTAVPALTELANRSRSALGRLHALYALDGLEALDVAQVLRALDDSEPRLREHAVQLSERFGTSPQVRDRLERLTEDDDVRVRYQLAFSLGSIDGDGPTRALVRLALRDGADSWMRLAILTSVGERSGEVFRRLLTENAFRSTPHGRTLLSALASQIGAANRANDVAAFVKGLDGLPESENPLAQELVRGLASKQPASARDRLSGAAAGRAGTLLMAMLRDAQQIAVDEKRPVAERTAAVRTLGLAPFAEVKSSFPALLALRQPQPVQAAALETLGRFEDASISALVLEAWPGLSPLLRAAAAETLFARSAGINAFLDAVEKGTVKPADVDPARIKLLEAVAEPTVRARISKLFAGAGLSKRQDVVLAYQPALERKGDPEKGRAVFKQHCSACHKLEGVGESVGADLAAVKDRGLEAVLLNILDPNREVKPQFLSYVLTTTAGRSLTGMIAAETANSLTLRKPDGGNETILRVNIEELRSTGISFMPEGLEKQIDLQAMADLLAYLNSIR